MIISISYFLDFVSGNSKMKICWDNLNKLYYDNKLLCLKDKHNNPYYFIDKCIICGELKKLYTSEEYQTFRQQVLEREDYKCEYCGEKAIHVHHSRPQKLEPGFALDPDFGVACCQKCHYKYGHKDECSTRNLANKVCI